MMKWMKTAQRTKDNLFAAIDEPYAETANYRLLMESVRSEVTPSGLDWQYALVNRVTGVVEYRFTSLPIAVLVMQNLQQQLSKVMTGELNGYAALPELRSTASPGDVPL